MAGEYAACMKRSEVNFLGVGSPSIMCMRQALFRSAAAVWSWLSPALRQGPSLAKGSSEGEADWTLLCPVYSRDRTQVFLLTRHALFQQLSPEPNSKPNIRIHQVCRSKCGVRMNSKSGHYVVLTRLEIGRPPASLCFGFFFF